MEKEDTQTLLDKLVVKEIKTQSDYLADKIRNMIVSRELSDGFKFPNEVEFCKTLNVSRATLREAYKILATQGFIRIAKHGTYVKCRDDIARKGDFAASLELAETGEMQEFVCALEPAAVFLAAKRIDAAGLEKLENLLKVCEEAADNPKELLKKNYLFHACIREFADNTLITSALAAYYDIFNHQIIENIYSSHSHLDEFIANSLVQHRELFDAIKNHDAERARDIAYHHLRDDVEANELEGKAVPS
ncbi:MAG: FCD domain-containing protein [Planctomycetaceae bacterium]|nr:FCD domain-containing protein [Planctomycetaceae bacterium]